MAPKAISAATSQQTRTNGSVEPRSAVPAVRTPGSVAGSVGVVHRLWTEPVDTVDTDRVAGRRAAAAPVDDGRADRVRRPQTAGMSIEMPAAEVHALAHALSRQAETAEDARAAAVRGRPTRWGRCLQAAARGVPRRPPDGSRRAGRRAAAGSGATVSAVADSWLALDGVLLAAAGGPRAE